MSSEKLSMKRSYSTSPSSSPPLTPKKHKTAKSNTNSPKNHQKTPNYSTNSGSASWTNEKKSLLIKRLVETGYKNMDWKLLSNETQMTEEQCKNQLTPGRSNLRKFILEMFK